MVLEFGLMDGGEDGEHAEVGFVDIFVISSMQGEIFFETMSFDSSCYHSLDLKRWIKV